jgi:hypothetical protein
MESYYNMTQANFQNIVSILLVLIPGGNAIAEDSGQRLELVVLLQVISFDYYVG